ncbi:TRAP transporter permease [Sneathiella chinensis]|uniref:C4-dicarboxylate ABC transporter n=1 Tax=Sneathiella chinensis TaxID=349750 RepID=A0ABQ5U7D6_9PROT|nr:TRAP transporter fused permease subunit [Sneathiella chinensis]GLQ07179.1 C4-dicarboxylate ABC transporter [Sneathiella chinensis]
MRSSDTPTNYQSDEIEDLESARYRRLSPFWMGLVLALTVISIALAANQLFHLGFFKLVLGKVLVTNRYMYLLCGVMLSMIYLLMPAHKKASRTQVPWYDALLFLTTLGLTAYYVYFAEDILDEAWEFNPTEHGKYVSVLFWALILETGRRAGGMAVFLIVLVISLYPIYADMMPDVISGVGQPFLNTAAFHTFSEESLLGIPMKAFTGIVFGFLLFGVALIYTGAGQFFINFAFALMGHVRGGPAKVAIFSSGLFGSMSGGPVTNVLTTGSLTIPAMRSIGVRAKTAGAIEACASTGGVMMPPIMGATAFIMADFLNVRYVDVALAAIIPSVLYYFGLFMQIDAHAAEHKLSGLPKEQLVSLKTVFKEGWYYIAVFVFLVWMLLFLKREAHAPFYATVLLLVINQFNPKHRLTWQKLRDMTFAVGGLLAELAGLLAAVGLIVGALQVTGMTGTLTNDLVYLAGGHPLALLLMGALTSFVLGIGMTVTAAYIFLAIILAPALVNTGLDPMSVHMFLLYWGMLSFITPPVALAAFAASSVAKSEPMETGVEAMKIGAIIYFVPFFFVFNPALLGNAPMGEIVVVCVTALIGITLVASALQGYLIGFGSLTNNSFSWVSRVLILLGGLAFAVPGGGMLPLSHLQLGIVGFLLAAVGTGLTFLGARKRALQ